MTWPEAVFYSVVAVLAAAVLYRVLELFFAFHKDLELRALRAESIEANKELERGRHELDNLRTKLEAATAELEHYQAAARKRHARRMSGNAANN